MNGSRSLLVAGAIVLSLSACASGPGEPVPPTVAASAAAGGADTATAVATAGASRVMDPADPATWRISADGVGPVRLGDPVARAIAAATAYVDVTARQGCPDARISYLAEPGASDSRMLLDADDSGSVVGIAISAPGPTTAEGVGFGSPISAVTAAYPSAAAGTRGPTSVSNLWTVIGDPGWVSYGFAPADANPTVLQVSVMRGGRPPYEWCG